MIFRILAMLLFAAVIVGSFWLGGDQRPAPSTTTVEAPSSDLGYSARDATLVETGSDGLPLYTLNANAVRQQPDDRVDFDQVKMTFRDVSGQVWKGEADQAQLTTGSGKVNLSGNVRVNGVLPGSAQPTELSTDKLAVDINDNLISTAEPVAISSPGRVLRSKGLMAALKDHHLVLESNVRGTFTP